MKRYVDREGLVHDFSVRSQETADLGEAGAVIERCCGWVDCGVFIEHVHVL